MEFYQLDPEEQERLTSVAVRRCTRKLGYDVNRQDVEDMKQEARAKMWQVCRDQGRNADRYDDAGYLIACGTNAAWHHWRRYVLQVKYYADAKDGGLAALTFPLDYYTSREDRGTWEEIIPYWQITPLVIEDDPPRQVLSDERWHMLYHLLPQFYPRITDRGRRMLLSVLGLLCEGHHQNQIADMLNVTPQSISKYRRRIRAFLAWLGDVELDEDNPYTEYGYTTRSAAPDLTAIPA